MMIIKFFENWAPDPVTILCMQIFDLKLTTLFLVDR